MSNMIGKERESKNFSKATSAVNRVADIKRIEKYDEYKIEKKTKFSIWMFLFIIIGIRLIIKDHLFWGGLIIVLPVILFVFRRVTYMSPVEVYKNGLITPAMITAIDNEGIELLYLAPMNKDRSSKIIFGCKKKKVKKLPETNVQIGAKIPCVSIFYPLGTMKGCWGNFDSRPLVWGFKDKYIIESAIFSLENDEDYEESCWSTLEKLAVIMETKTTDTLIYFNEDLEIVYGTPDEAHTKKKIKRMLLIS